MGEELSLFFTLLRRGMGEDVPLPQSVTEEQMSAVWQLALKQDLAHLVASVPELPGLLAAESPLQAELVRYPVLAVYRAEQQQFALQQIGETFTQAKIPFLPLKGAVLRAWYPQPWMRTGCDIDLLVRAEQLEEACAALEKMHYRRGKQGAHDISFFSENQVHIELHHQLVEEGRAAKSNQVLSAVWQRCHPVQPDEYRYEMPDAQFYFYHIAHMAKHIEAGGCGVRYFLDLWVLEGRAHNRQQRDDLLAQGGLLTFANACRRLAAVWFGDAQPDETCQLLQAYILGGGVYGSSVNRVAVAQNRKGKGRHLVSRIFPPYRKIRWDYPVLLKHPYLLPVCWIRRWCRLLFGGKVPHSMRKIKAAEKQNTTTAQLFERLEL